MKPRWSMLCFFALQLSLCAYCVWQLWWMAAAWGLVSIESEPVAEMASSIDARIARMQTGLVFLGCTAILGAGASVFRSAAADREHESSSSQAPPMG